MIKITNSKDGALAIIKFLRAGKRFGNRDDIMFLTGFPSPKDQPVCAYVLFQNSIIEANRRLRPLGGRIERLKDEVYTGRGRVFS